MTQAGSSSCRREQAQALHRGQPMRQHQQRTGKRDPPVLRGPTQLAVRRYVGRRQCEREPVLAAADLPCQRDRRLPIPRGTAGRLPKAETIDDYEALLPCCPGTVAPRQADLLTLNRPGHQETRLVDRLPQVDTRYVLYGGVLGGPVTERRGISPAAASGWWANLSADHHPREAARPRRPADPAVRSRPLPRRGGPQGRRHACP